MTDKVPKQTATQVENEEVQDAQENAPDPKELNPEFGNSTVKDYTEILEFPAQDDRSCAAHIPTGEEEDDGNGNKLKKTRRIGMREKSSEGE